ncbi:MAG: AAA family ATPase [Sedimentisphaerales bacterium]|nr:AAA family ATPase [Sedimentisphaerales bacterium]
MNTQNHNVSNTSCYQTAPPSSVFHPLDVLLRRRWQLLACLFVVAGLAFAATVLRNPQYEATARVQIVLDQPSIGGKSIASLGNQDYFSTQCQLLQSRHVLVRAAKKLNFNNSGDNLTEKELEELEEILRVRPVPGSRLIDIIGISENKNLAAAVANQVTAAFIETSSEARRAATTRLVERVQQQIDNYDKQIAQLEDQATRFRQEHLISDGKDILSSVNQKIQNLQQQINQTDIKRVDLETRREKLAELLRNERGVDSRAVLTPEVDNHPAVQNLARTIDDLRQEEAQLLQVYLPGHQKLESLRLRIASLENNLAKQKRNVLTDEHQNTIDQLKVIADQATNLQQLLYQSKEQAVMLTDKFQEYQKLTADIDMTRRFRDECMCEVRQFILQEGMCEAPVQIVDAAQVPSRIAGMTKAQRASSILLLGLLFSITFIFALDRFSQGQSQNAAVQMQQVPWMAPWWAVPPTMAANTPVASAAPTETAADSETPVASELSSEPDDPTVSFTPTETASEALGRLGTIELGGESVSQLAFAARCRIMQTDQSSPQAGVFRQIAVQLIQRFARARQSLVITGAEEGGGKTTSACNLATALAQAGRKVLLVDAQQRRPMLAKIYHSDPDKPGFNSVLSDIALLDEALHDTEINNLKVLHHQTAESWKGNDGCTLRELDAHLRRRFDWVIYDTDRLSHDWTRMLLDAVGKAVVIAPQGEPMVRNRTVADLELTGAVCLGVIETSHQISSSESAAVSSTSASRT